MLPKASSIPSMRVTHTGIPTDRSRSTSTRRFSSWLATTRSGRSAAMAAWSGFLVPRTRVMSRPAGWVHQFVAPTSTPGTVRAIASVSDGTNETTRSGGWSSAASAPRSSSTPPLSTCFRMRESRSIRPMGMDGYPNPVHRPPHPRQHDPSKLGNTPGRQGIMNFLSPDACVE